MNFHILRLKSTSITSCNTLDITIAFLHYPTTTNDPSSHALFLQEEVETNRHYPVMHQCHGSSWPEALHKPPSDTHTFGERTRPLLARKGTDRKRRKRNFGPVILPRGQYHNQEAIPVNLTAQPFIKACCRRSRHFSSASETAEPFAASRAAIQ